MTGLDWARAAVLSERPDMAVAPAMLPFRRNFLREKPEEDLEKFIVFPFVESVQVNGGGLISWLQRPHLISVDSGGYQFSFAGFREGGG